MSVERVAIRVSGGSPHYSSYFLQHKKKKQTLPLIVPIALRAWRAWGHTEIHGKSARRMGVANDQAR